MSYMFSDSALGALCQLVFTGKVSFSRSHKKDLEKRNAYTCSTPRQDLSDHPAEGDDPAAAAYKVVRWTSDGRLQLSVTRFIHIDAWY